MAETHLRHQLPPNVKGSIVTSLILKVQHYKMLLLVKLLKKNTNRMKKCELKLQPSPKMWSWQVRNDVCSSSSKPASELQSIRCHIGSRSVSCHPKQVHAFHFNSARKDG